jgi:PTS system glucose-specific IIC component
MMSAALTSFLTGITEPLEFAFLFVAPRLYAAHALLSGAAFTVCIVLGIKHGTTFSHGLFDYIALFPQSTNALWFLVLGPAWGMLYYGTFRFMIRAFDLKTPGREDVTEGAGEPLVASSESIAAQLVGAFGGADNLKSLDACITRLRIEVKDVSRVNKDRLKALGSSGTVVIGSGVQSIFGPLAEIYKTEMQEYMDAGGTGSTQGASSPATLTTTSTPRLARSSGPPIDMKLLLLGLGGRENIKDLTACATTRLRLNVKDASTVDLAGLSKAGVLASVKVSDHLLHLIVGLQAETLAEELRAACA